MSGTAFWRLETHEALASTQQSCIERAEAGAPAGLAVLALRQTAGRGRQGRAWTGAHGNLAMTALLRPRLAAAALPAVSLLAGVALIEVLGRHATGLRLKWPNDILRGQGKLAGLLVDAACHADGACAWVAIGCGANLACAPRLPDRATASLADCGPPPVQAVAGEVLERLGWWMGRLEQQGVGPIRDAWLGHADRPGTALRVRCGGAMLDGRFAGLDPSGALLLEQDGVVRRVASGELEPGSVAGEG